MTLSAKHIEVRDFILGYQSRHQEIPSLKQIAEACHLSNAVTAWRYRKKLLKAGELKFIGYESAKTKAAGA
jgi:hypothetical protein